MKNIITIFLLSFSLNLFAGICDLTVEATREEGRAFVEQKCGAYCYHDPALSLKKCTQQGYTCTSTAIPQRQGGVFHSVVGVKKFNLSAKELRKSACSKAQACGEILETYQGNEDLAAEQVKLERYQNQFRCKL